MIKYLILVLAILSNVSAQISLRYAMRNIQINRNSKIIEKAIEVFSNWYIWQGLFFYGIGFSLYLYILSKFEVSYIYPLVTASIFILLLTFSPILLGESISTKRILGIIVIIIGIFIASQ